MADLQLDIDIAALRRELESLKGSLQGVKNASGDAFNEASDGAKESVTNVQRLEREYKDLEQSAKVLEGALRRATDPKAIQQYSAELAKLRSGQKQLEESAGRLGANLKATNKELSTGKQVVSEFFAAFSVAAAISGIAALTARAIELAKNYEKAQKQFTALLGNAKQANELIGQLERLAGTTPLDVAQTLEAGRALVSFGESAGNVETILKRVGDISAGTGKDFNELAIIYGKARVAGVLYAEDINQLVEAGVPIIQEFSKQMNVSTAEVKKLASEGKIGFGELELAFQNLTSQGGKFFGQLDAQSQTLAGRQANLNSEWDRLLRTLGELLLPVLETIVGYFSNIVNGLNSAFDSTKSWGERLKGIVNSLVPITGYLDDIITQARELVGLENKKNEALDAGREKYEQEKDARNESNAAEQKAAKEREKLRAESDKKEVDKRRKEAQQRQNELDRLRIEALKDGIQKELAVEDLRYKTLLRELRKYGIDTAQATEQHLTNVAKIRTKYAIDEILQRQKEQEEALKLEQAYLDELQNLTEQDAERRAAAIARNQKAQADLSELEAANFEGLQLLQKRLFFEKKRTAEEVQAFDEQQAKARELFQLEQQAAELQRELDFAGTLDSARRSILEKQIQNIRDQADQIKNEIGGGGKSDPKKSILAQILGVDDESAKEIEKAISVTISAINEIIENAIQDADNRLQAATDRVDEARSKLEEEQELQKQGFANNVDARQKELDDAKRAQAQALEDKKRAQRLQLAVDATTQASNIAVSVSNIIRNFSQIPFVGVVLALAQVASLFAFLSSVKTRARAISAATFREGGSAVIGKDGFIAGPSHEQGGVPIEVEGGEMMHSDGRRVQITNKRMTKKHFSLLDAINRDDRPAMRAYIDQLAGRPAPSFDRPQQAAPGSAGAINDRTGRRMVGLLEEGNRISRRTAAKPESLTIDTGKEIIIRRGHNVTILKK
mgnify:CR=1 FL=1